VADPKWLNRFVPIAALVLADLVAVGMGMGVPAFAILLGFPAGWWLARSRGLRGALRWGGALVAFTFVMMLAIWGPSIRLIADPAFDAAEWGIPLVLYTSAASFWGWQALMIVISPGLQFMAVATGAALATTLRDRTAEKDGYSGASSTRDSPSSMTA